MITGGTGIGRKREPWRIGEYLASVGLNQAKLARQLGITKAVVNHTVHGKINNRKVLRALIELGCPRKYLDLPADMQPGKAA